MSGEDMTLLKTWLYSKRHAILLWEDLIFQNNQSNKKIYQLKSKL